MTIVWSLTFEHKMNQDNILCNTWFPSSTVLPLHCMSEAKHSCGAFYVESLYVYNQGSPSAEDAVTVTYSEGLTKLC